METSTGNDGVLWSIYIISLDNRGNKTKFYGLNKAYYTGISTNVGKRIGDYLFKRGKEGWVNKYWKDARVIPVFISHFFGTKSEAMGLERSIKRRSREKKEELIDSESNKLIGYKPCKYLVVKKYKEDGEEIVSIY